MSQVIRKELLAELQHLRTEAKEISRLYVANLQRDIVQLIEFVNDAEKQSEPLLSRMKESLDELKLKPEKGRRKDLRRIEEAIRSLNKMVANKM